MFEERSEQLRRVTMLLDIALTVFVFLAVSWLRIAVLDDDPADLLSHVALLPFVLALWMFFLTFFSAYVSRTVMVTFAATDLVALVGVRLGVVWYFRRSLRRGEYFRRVLIVGSGTR